MAAARRSLRGRWTLILVAIAPVAILAVNLWWRHELPEDPHQKLMRLQAAGLHQHAHPIFEALLEDDVSNLDLHYGYITNFFEIRGTRKLADSLLSRYAALPASPELQDIFHYCRGLIHVHIDDYEEALRHYVKIQDRNRRYVNNSTGFAHLQLGHSGTAERLFRQEIALKGNVGGAVANLTDLYLGLGELEKLDKLLLDEELGPLVGHRAQRKLALRKTDLFTYLGLLLVPPQDFTDLKSALVSLVICLMWFVYFWRIDVFEQEPIRYTLLALVAGVGSVYVTYFLGDLVAELFPIQPDGGWRTDLSYNLFQIALVEEISKLLPVFLLVRLTSQVNEPVDYLIYGSLSALGFATFENAMYFSNYGLGIVFVRFMMSTTGHLTNTCIICFAWASARHFTKGDPGWNSGWRVRWSILGGLLLATALHGVYNFVLTPEWGLSLLVFALVLVEIALLNTMIRICLDRSPFSTGALADSSRLSNTRLLTATGVGLLLVSFLYENFTLSTGIANESLAYFGLLAGVVGIFMVRKLGTLHLRSNATM